MIQETFQQAVDTVVDLCQGYFGDRLLAVYIAGSVGLGEAFAGESDLDYWAFVKKELKEDDKLWVQQTEVAIEKQFPVFKSVHIHVESLTKLREEKFWRFILKYNSVLYKGNDVIAELEQQGYETYAPDKAVAKSRLKFARKCFTDALAGLCPACLDEVPKNTYFAARKFARYFVIVEGTYLLMTRGTFNGYKQEEVIELLKQGTEGWDNVLDLSLRVLTDPINAGVGHVTYLETIRPFVEWLFDEIERA